MPSLFYSVSKIAREFIRKIGENQANDAIIASIISLGHNLEMLVLAEDVEDQERLDYLESHSTVIKYKDFYSPRRLLQKKLKNIV